MNKMIKCISFITVLMLVFMWGPFSRGHKRYCTSVYTSDHDDDDILTTGVRVVFLVIKCTSTTTTTIILQLVFYAAV